MSHRRASRRAAQAAYPRLVSALLITFALVVQLALAERHFHPVLVAAPAGVSAASGTAPAGPLTGQPEDDCALCQILALGASTDVPHATIAWQASPAIERRFSAVADAALRDLSAGPHRARAPPRPLAA